MSDTLTTLQQKIASTVDQTVTTPTADGAEWNLRMYFLNRALEEWSTAYDWDALRKTYWVTPTGGATISLPSDFRKMATFPVAYSTGISTGEQWPEYQPHEVSRLSTDSHYFYVLGNRGSGYSMIWNPGSLASGASVYIQYYAYPLSLVTAGSVTQIPDQKFLVDRAIAYIFEAKNDQRFQTLEVKARERLLQMIDDENVKSRAYRNAVETPENLYYSFRIGRD